LQATAGKILSDFRGRIDSSGSGGSSSSGGSGEGSGWGTEDGMVGNGRLLVATRTSALTDCAARLPSSVGCLLWLLL
ncbi:hypothetical protein CLOP_g9151, partial [Closterium sp. NIES-67]